MRNAPETLDEVSDEQLFERYLSSGDQHSFEVLAERHQAYLSNLLLKRTGDYNLTQDLLQETWIKFWMSNTSLPKKFSIRQMLARIATSLVIDAFRKKGRKHAPMVWHPADFYELAAPEEPILFREEIAENEEASRKIVARIRKMILKLDGKDQRALALLLDGLTPNEIAEELGVRPGSVYAYLCNGRKALRKLLEESGIVFRFLQERSRERNAKAS